MEKERDDIENKVQIYTSTLREVIEMFESCGCSADVTAPGPSQAVLTIRGPISFCPVGIFDEHEEKAKELMQTSYPEVAFSVEKEESE